MSSTEGTSLKDSARRHCSVINASTAGAASKQATKAQNVSEFVKVTKALLDFQILQLQATKNLLEELSAADDNEKMEALFLLLDRDMDGAIDAVELADGLRKVRGDVNFEESLAVAIERVLQFDENGTGKLSLEDFKTYVETLCVALGTNFHEVSEMFILQVLFNQGNSEVENFVGDMAEGAVTEAIQEEEAMRKTMTDKRMKALFLLFDTDGSGTVDFTEVVLGLFKITQDIEGASKAALMALLMFDDDATRTLDYEAFARFMINVVVATPEDYTFDDIADAMTLLAMQDVQLTREEIKALYELDEEVQKVLDMKEEQEILANVTESQLTKAFTLFSLWDLDHDGSISIKELILGLRKFEQTDSMETTVDEAIGLMEAYDVDGDHSLDRSEFCLFMVQFAQLAGAGLDETLDFMVAVSSVEENSETEVKLMKALTESDIFHLF